MESYHAKATCLLRILCLLQLYSGSRHLGIDRISLPIEVLKFYLQLCDFILRRKSHVSQQFLTLSASRVEHPYSLGIAVVTAFVLSGRSWEKASLVAASGHVKRSGPLFFIAAVDL
jgi:hypothetical protein